MDAFHPTCVEAQEKRETKGCKSSTQCTKCFYSDAQDQAGSNQLSAWGSSENWEGLGHPDSKSRESWEDNCVKNSWLRCEGHRNTVNHGEDSRRTWRHGWGTYNKCFLASPKGTKVISCASCYWSQTYSVNTCSYIFSCFSSCNSTISSDLFRCIHWRTPLHATFPLWSSRRSFLGSHIALCIFNLFGNLLPKGRKCIDHRLRECVCVCVCLLLFGSLATLFASVGWMIQFLCLCVRYFYDHMFDHIIL